MSTLKNKKARLESDVLTFTKSSTELSEKAENAKGLQNIRQFIVKANSMRRSASAKSAESTEIDAQIDLKMKELREEL